MKSRRGRIECELAFSRTELIVVVAVAGVLILAGISGRAGARNRVYQTVDLDNHGRILKAVNSYAVDHTDFLPNVGWGTTRDCWAHAANIPVGGASSVASYEVAHEQQLTFVTNGQLFPYLNDSRVLMCPADKPDGVLFWQRSIYITSYTWNGAVNGYGYLTNSYKLSQFGPDSVLDWEADENLPFFINDCSEFPDEGFSGRHSPEALVGQFGGSVTTVLTTNWYSKNLAGPLFSSPHGSGVPSNLLPNRVWCNPRCSDGVACP